jgi:hypothetical protein
MKSWELIPTRQNWFKAYLNTTQQQILLSTKSADIYQIQPQEKFASNYTRFPGFSMKTNQKSLKSFSDDQSQHYLIHAHQNWKPNSNSIKYFDQGFGFFVVLNISDVNILSSDPNILSFQKHKFPKLLMDFAGGFLLSHQQKPKWDKDRFWIPRILHEKGLTGQGLIATVLDTGLDIYHPFFYDPDYKSNLYDVNISNHRKLKYYDSFQDKTDFESGHGTHVSGILLGKEFNSNSGISTYEGISPDSKIYFIDCLKNNNSEFIIPNLAVILSKMKVFGSKIFSNSYGLEHEDGLFTYQIDYISYQTPEILLLASAGNNYVFNSITAPATSKNVLAIGSINNVASINLRTETSRKIKLKFGDQSIEAKQVSQDPYSFLFYPLF